MHRSGTSALTRVLNLLGAGLPLNLLPADEHNAAGYWESCDLVFIHDEMLQAAGTSWQDTGPIPELWHNPQFIGSVLQPGFETLGWAYSGGQL
jgi:hypothetical protein